MTQNWFASSIAEERVVARGGKLVSELARFDRGWAKARLRGTWIELDAGDGGHARGMPEAIEAHLASKRPEPPAVDLDPDDFAGWRFHAITRRRIALHRGGAPDEQTMKLVIVTAPSREQRSVSIVATPRALAGRARRLASALATPQAPPSPLDALPVAFSHGSGAVLMHEAVGHPSERSAPHVAWPDWLEVADDPFASPGGHSTLDDCGRPVARRDLTRGESPSALRRWSFRDTPIVRMTTLRVAAAGAPVSLPSPRVEIQVVDHGSWDPVTDEVTLRIAIAELVDGRDRGLLPPFTFRASRRELATRLAGWFGEATAYPGVICSDEGQALPVGSISTGLLLRPR